MPRKPATKPKLALEPRATAQQIADHIASTPSPDAPARRLLIFLRRFKIEGCSDGTYPFVLWDAGRKRPFFSLPVLRAWGDSPDARRAIVGCVLLYAWDYTAGATLDAKTFLGAFMDVQGSEEHSLAAAWLSDPFTV